MATILFEVRVVVVVWVSENLHKTDYVVADLVSLLNEDIFLTTPRPKGVRLPKKAGGTELAIFVEAYGGASVGLAPTTERGRQKIFYNKCKFCTEALVAELSQRGQKR